MKNLLCLLIALPIAAATTNGDIAKVAARVDCVVGLAAIDLDTGRTVAIRGDEAFPMASVFKFPLAIEVLRRVDAGQLRLDATYTLTPADFGLGHSPIRDGAGGKAVILTLRELVRAAVADSDNTAADYLLRMVKPPAVTERMRVLGTPGIRVDRTEKEIIQTLATPGGVTRYAVDARDTATPLAAAALMGRFARRNEGLSSAAHDFLAEALGPKSKNPVRIGKLLPKSATVIHKTGTMPGTMNDVALVTTADGKHHIAIAILTKASKKSTDAQREQVIAAIAKLVYDQFAR